MHHRGYRACAAHCPRRGPAPIRPRHLRPAPARRWRRTGGRQTPGPCTAAAPRCARGKAPRARRCRYWRTMRPRHGFRRRVRRRWKNVRRWPGRTTPGFRHAGERSQSPSTRPRAPKTQRALQSTPLSCWTKPGNGQAIGGRSSIGYRVRAIRGATPARRQPGGPARPSRDLPCGRIPRNLDLTQLRHKPAAENGEHVS